MFRVLYALAGAIFLISVAAPHADAQREGLTEVERAEIGEVVRDYILENPEVIEEALIELQRRAQQRELDSYIMAIAAQGDAIYTDPRDPSIGPDDAPIVIVEFMDYKCGYCRVAARWVNSAMETHGGQIRFILKEYPILGEESREASRAALAALRQGEDEYFAFHNAMIQSSGPLPSGRIDNFAAVAGLDVDQMRRDMEDPAIDAQLEDIYRLGRTLGADGTPFFIVDGMPVPGANTQALEAALQRAIARVEG